MKTLLQILALVGSTAFSTSAQETFAVNLSGANEVPPNNSPSAGSGWFTLEGNVLNYGVGIGWSFWPTGAGLYGPARPGSNGPLIFDWPTYLIEAPWPSGGITGGVGYLGGYFLDPVEIEQLRAGRWYVSIKSSDFPRGELRGQILPSEPIVFTATFSGRSEVPPNRSPYHGTGVFTLSGSSLAYSIALDEKLLPLSAGIFGPARHHTGSQHAVANLDITLGVLIPPGGLPGQPGSPGQVLYTGTITLTEQQVSELVRRELYADIGTSRHSNGEIRGQIQQTRREGETKPWKYREEQRPTQRSFLGR
jgi:CHRD domain